MAKSLEQRFWEKVNKDGPGGCWLWTASFRNEQGYGQFGVSGRTVVAHRMSYELMVGPIPDGLVLDHLCRVRRCVNPAHLRPVTDRENILAPGALGITKAMAEKTHCANGHEFTPENTARQGPDGRYRRCKTCNRNRVREFHDSRRSETCTCGTEKLRRKDGSLYCKPCLSEQTRQVRRRRREVAA